MGRGLFSLLCTVRLFSLNEMMCNSLACLSKNALPKDCLLISLVEILLGLEVSTCFILKNYKVSEFYGAKHPWLFCGPALSFSPFQNSFLFTYTSVEVCVIFRILYMSWE
jgi:hypothetical protein